MTMINTVKTLALAALLGVASCASVDPADIAGSARPNQPPTPAVTRFEEPLKCMDEAFADFGVSGVTIAVSAVPDYTGRVFVGSDIWLQSAINKMSQRSGAFVVTDYNPNQLAPEQGLWTLSGKEGFYIPAYYVRGAISGFAGNVAENSARAGLGTPLDGAAIGREAAYSLISVDLTVGNLQQRTLISRAQASNEVVLESRASGTQLGGMLEKYGANLEILASRSDGVPSAVRALVELDAIEVLGRLTGVPYWACLGAGHDDPAARQARRDIHFNMSGPERQVFVQRRLARLGYYDGPVNGMESPALSQAVSAFAARQRLAQDLAGLDLYQALTDWRPGAAREDIRQATLAPALAGPASQPVQSALEQVSRSLSVQVALVAASRRPGAPVALSLRSNAEAHAYCYIEDMSGSIARVFPNRWQPDPLLEPSRDVRVPGSGAGFELVLPQRGVRENVVCFISRGALGAALPDRLKGEDLTALPVASMDALVADFRRSAERLADELVVEQVVLDAN